MKRCSPRLRGKVSASAGQFTASAGEARSGERCRHLLVMNMPGRKLVIIHPTNDASCSSGCVAPVTLFKDEEKGVRSGLAMEILTSLVYEVFNRTDRFHEIIQSTVYDPG